MTTLLIFFVALVVSALTLFSGFGLGTLLMPVLAIVFPPEVAIAATAIVHLANNLFKLAIVGRWADRRVTLAFGVPALLAAIAGAWLLAVLAHHNTTLFGYTIPLSPTRAIHASTTLVDVVVGGMILLFGLLEPWSRFEKLALPPRFLPLGGVLSGFFGGLSGHQGALRSVFLVRAGLDSRAFLGTGAVCSTIVDTARLAMYFIGAGVFAHQLGPLSGGIDWSIVAIACLGAFIGSFGGAKLVKKVTLRTIRVILSVCMVLLGAAMIAGLV